jgi:hypothetical protein
MKRRVSLLFLLAVLAPAMTAADSPRGSNFRGWTNFAEWDRTFGSQGETVLTGSVFAPPIAADEVVVSWNAETPSHTGMSIEARALYADRTTKWFTLGLWARETGGHPRESVRNQRDTDGDVETDTLVLAEGAWRLQLRLRLTPARGHLPTVRFLGVSALDRRASLPPLAPNRRAWDRLLAVPQRSQLDYAGGEQTWCSPTSVSMILSFWARQLKRFDLEQTVPEVARGVMDPNWPGTGNWAFNTAYAATFAGMRAYVTRLSDVTELEDWVAAGVPVVASIDYDVLRGLPTGRSGGHLVVVVGFTAAGDPVLNDPGTRHQLQRAWSRGDFARAWAASRGTVYLVYPQAWPTPRDRYGHWFTGREPR